ncbi:hypothetical protein T12_4305 [Trichinella patagoniensis]|uniref:Uncharacterized protein n=1 Tax=Trichinella patagoniensis TaxID=990121 RepID=A0A0V0Z958_9BILA|nr:hypothetical protein T12_4305 [Trichinella patagoniensis]
MVETGTACHLLVVDGAILLSQLTDFPMYRLAEVEVAALYPRIQEVALNRGDQGCFKIRNYSHRLSYVPPGRSGSSSPVPAYSGSSPESRVSGLFQNQKLLFVD